MKKYIFLLLLVAGFANAEDWAFGKYYGNKIDTTTEIEIIRLKGNFEFGSSTWCYSDSWSPNIIIYSTGLGRFTRLQVSTVTAIDNNGMYFMDNGGNLFLYLENGGNIGVGTTDLAALLTLRAAAGITLYSYNETGTAITGTGVTGVSGFGDTRGGYFYSTTTALIAENIDTVNGTAATFLGKVYAETGGFVGFISSATWAVYASSAGWAEAASSATYLTGTVYHIYVDTANYALYAATAAFCTGGVSTAAYAVNAGTSIYSITAGTAGWSYNSELLAGYNYDWFLDTTTAKTEYVNAGGDTMSNQLFFADTGNSYIGQSGGSLNVFCPSGKILYLAGYGVTGISIGSNVSIAKTLDLNNHLITDIKWTTSDRDLENNLWTNVSTSPTNVDDVSTKGYCDYVLKKATNTLLSLSSATLNFMTKSSTTLNFLTLSSAAATYMHIAERNDFAAYNATATYNTDLKKDTNTFTGGNDWKGSSTMTVLYISTVSAKDANGLYLTNQDGATMVHISTTGAITKPQNPCARAYLANRQLNISSNTWTKVLLETENYDVGSNFDTTNNRFVAPVTGYYQVNAIATYLSQGVDKYQRTAIYVNGAIYSSTFSHSSSVDSITGIVNDIVYATVGQYIELYANPVNTGTGNTDISEGTTATYMSVTLLQ